MHRSNKFAYLNLFQIATDILTILASFIFSYYFTTRFTSLYVITDYNWILGVFLPFWILIMRSQEMYNDTYFNYYDRTFICILKATIISGVFVVAIIYMVKLTIYSRMFLLTFLFLNVFFVFIERLLYYKFKLKYNISNSKRVIIIGTPELYDRFLYYLEKTNIRFHIIGFINVNNGTSLDNHVLLGKTENLEDIVKKYYVDEIIFTLPKEYISEIEKYIILCEKMGVTNRVLLDLYGLEISKTHIGSLGTLPMITFHTVNLNRSQLLIKRLLDITGASVGIIITFILGIIIAIAIKLESKGPVIFSQKRAGLNGRVFNCYKFRSMYVNAEERKSALIAQNEVHSNLMFKIKDDPRITKVGKFIRKTSLDELPQFFNVLKGDMSLVGTRPPTLDEVQQYGTYHRRRISISPGITGMWQVNGRNNIKDFDKVVKLDTEYIDNWSIFLDIKIIFKTILVVFGYKSGAY